MMKLAAMIFAGVLFMTIANAQEPTPKASPTPVATPKKKTEAKKESAKSEAGAVKKLTIEDMIVGTGKEATKGKTVKVNYTGWLYETGKSMGRGQQIDTSIGREPFSFTLGSGQVIKGWDDGLEKMKVGGKRKLIIPSDMAYGKRGAGNVIPPNSPLMFEVELLDVN